MSLPPLIKEISDTARCLHTRDQVEAALDVMAQQIREQFENENPLILCVMIGGVIPTAGLLARLTFPLQLDYVHASRYEKATTGGQIKWKREPGVELRGRKVIIVDDILDGGITLQAIIDYCQSKQAASVHTAVLIDKNVKRDEGGLAQADFVGLTVENFWLFGYGLDYQEYWRNAPGIYAVDPKYIS